jgi:hypothetical protein
VVAFVDKVLEQATTREQKSRAAAKEEKMSKSRD